MKKMRWILWVFVAFSTIIILPSCNHENFDDFEDFENPNEEENPNTGNGNTDTGGNSTNIGTGDYVALYEISGDQIIKINDGADGANWMQDDFKHQEIWNRVTQLIEAGDRPWIKQLMIIDGGGELYGFVQQLDDNLNEWVMGLAIDAAYPNQNDFDKDGEMTYTIIHEFAHVLTLNNEQLNPNSNGCSTYNPGEGCSHQNSYINQFFGNYWTSIFGEHSQIDESDYDALDDFYQKYQDYFVTDYAATNPVEDIAESFTQFVTLNNAPSGNTVANQKVKFMYDYSELVTLRNFMKSQGQALVRPKNWKGCRHTQKGTVLLGTRKK